MGLLFIATSEEDKAKNREDHEKTSGYPENGSTGKLESERGRFGPDELGKRGGHAADKISPEQWSYQPEK